MARPGRHTIVRAGSSSTQGLGARVSSSQKEGKTLNQVIATEDQIVHDDALGIDRKLVAGQPVPPDLVEAYREAGGDVPDDYDPSSVQRVGTPNDDVVVAKKDVIVHDDQLNIDRKIVAGQPVPADLRKAYAEETGESVPESDSDTVDYDKKSVEELEDEVDRRGLEVEGTGADGNVLKKDLVAALKADDAA